MGGGKSTAGARGEAHSKKHAGRTHLDASSRDDENTGSSRVSGRERKRQRQRAMGPAYAWTGERGSACGVEGGTDRSEARRGEVR